MQSSNFVSGEVLFNAKNRPQVLPSWGEKLSEVCGSSFEKVQLEQRLQDRHALISELRVARKDQLATGQWIKESKMVQLIQQTGTFWDHMGVETDIGRCLYPEEALYLIEMGELEVSHGGMPLCVQSAHAVMLSDGYHLDQYLVYAHLTRTGCKVVRHQPHLRFTRYEKQIRLDQHQAKKKKKKLKLKNEDDEVQEITCVSATKDDDNEVEIIEDPPNMDDALKDFYETLGEEVKPPPLGTQEEQPEVTEIYYPPDIRKRETSKNEPPADKYLDKYEKKKQEYLDMLPSMCGSDPQIVHIEETDLYPEESVPQKKVYEINLNVLNYYSRYKDDGESQDFSFNYHQSNRWHRNRSNYRGNKRNSHHTLASRQDFEGNGRAWGRGRNDNRYDTDYATHSQWSNSRNERDTDRLWKEGRRGQEDRFIDDKSSDYRQFRKRKMDDGNYDQIDRGRHNINNGRWNSNHNNGRYDEREKYIGDSRGDSSKWDDVRWENDCRRHERLPSNRLDRKEYDHKIQGNRNVEGENWHTNDRSSYTDRVASGSGSQRWYQHDDRSSISAQEDSHVLQNAEKHSIDLTIVPSWKNKRRQRRRDRNPATYPSYLTKLPVQVHSWKEYKSIVNSMSEDNILVEGIGGVLWRGPTIPLVKPSMATSLSNVLEKCSLMITKKEMRHEQHSLPKELHLTLHFDAYLPNAPYRKSNPPIPSKRITVIRDGFVPSLKQIQEVAKRFPDEAPVVSAVIIAGEVRLYTLSPCMLHPPKPS